MPSLIVHGQTITTNMIYIVLIIAYIITYLLVPIQVLHNTFMTFTRFQHFL